MFYKKNQKPEKIREANETPSRETGYSKEFIYFINLKQHFSFTPLPFTKTYCNKNRIHRGSMQVFNSRASKGREF